MSDALHDKGKALEDLFFAERDRQLIQAMKDKAAKEQAAVDLGQVTGIRDAAVLARLAQLGVTPDSLAAFSIVPLLYVAWADRVLDPAEREAVVTEAHAAGIASDSAAGKLLEAWLHESPDDSLFDAWKTYHAALAELLTAAEKQTLHDDLMEKARSVARASGGLLGFGSVSADEKAALAKLEELLG